MKKIIVLSVVTAVAFFSLYSQSGAYAPSTGDSGFDSVLMNINLEASLSLPEFKAEMSIEFNAATTLIDTLFNVEKIAPADVYCILEISSVISKPAATVIEMYKKNKANGWKFILSQLGIKPGSKEFKALKERGKKKNEMLKEKRKIKEKGNNGNSKKNK